MVANETVRNWKRGEIVLKSVRQLCYFFLGGEVKNKIKTEKEKKQKKMGVKWMEKKRIEGLKENKSLNKLAMAICFERKLISLNCKYREKICLNRRMRRKKKLKI